jgi:hypothetical protein
MDNPCGNLRAHHPHQWGGPGNDDWRCPGIAEKAGTVGQEGRGSWERPEHYGGEENPFEPIKIIEHYDLNFNLGNAIKYVLRAPFKGTPLKDLKKAYTYIGFEIRRRERAGETEE